MTTAQKAHQFILNAIAEGRTVYLSNPRLRIKIDSKVVAKFKKANYDLFKFDREGNLVMASGKQYNIICCKDFSILQIAAS